MASYSGETDVWINGTSNSSLEYEQSHFDPCRNFEDKVERLSDSFHRYPSYMRPLAISLYSVVACLGAGGNFLVILSVICNPQMRIPRNYFIISLASSDLLMCTVTVPFTMYNTFNTFWNLSEITCRSVSALQGVNLFVSTMSITAIGLDRYWVILFPTKAKQQRMLLILCFLLIWLLSTIFASPLFFATALRVIGRCGHKLIVCAEEWDTMPVKQTVYSICCMVFQYLLPIAMLTFLYGRIIFRLKERIGAPSVRHPPRLAPPPSPSPHVLTPPLPSSTLTEYTNYNSSSTLTIKNADGSTVPSITTNNHREERRRVIMNRQRRTNILLISIVIVFAVSWLPLNIYNLVVSFGFDYELSIFAFCHVVGVSSAFANPILYGVFNENFRAEFLYIFWLLRSFFCCHWHRTDSKWRREMASAARRRNRRGGGKNRSGDAGCRSRSKSAALDNPSSYGCGQQRRNFSQTMPQLEYGGLSGVHRRSSATTNNEMTALFASEQTTGTNRVPILTKSSMAIQETDLNVKNHSILDDSAMDNDSGDVRI